MKSFLRTWNFISNHPLGSRNKREALRRWIQWQAGAMIMSRPIIMPFVGNAVLVVEPGMTGATGNIYCGLHEFRDMSLVLHFLRNEDLFLDVGANVGSYTVLAAAVAGARCIALEPVKNTFDRLERNLRVNDIKEKVESHCCAAGSAQGVIRFTTDQDTTNHAVLSGDSEQAIDVPANTIDHILGARISAMWKIDVEGFEPQVLAGAALSLRDENLKVVLVETDNLPLKSLMEGAGFTRASYDPFTREMILVKNVPACGNVLWIRDPDYVATRCRTAPLRTVLGIEF